MASASQRSDESRVKRVIDHYESQTEEEAVAEDEAAYEQQGETLMEVPDELVPVVRKLIATHRLRIVARA